MRTNQSVVDQKVGSVAAWLAGKSSRRSWLGRLSGLLFGGFAMHGLPGVAQARSLATGCVVDNANWQSQHDGSCKFLPLGVKVMSSLVSCQTGSQWTYDGLQNFCATSSLNGLSWAIASDAEMKGLIDGGLISHIDVCGTPLSDLSSWRYRGWAGSTFRKRGQGNKLFAHTYVMTDSSQVFDDRTNFTFLGQICVSR